MPQMNSTMIAPTTEPIRPAPSLALYQPMALTEYRSLRTAPTIPRIGGVDDVAAARAELEAAGVGFPAETMDSGVCHMAHFSDPDGNVLMLHHRYAPPG